MTHRVAFCLDLDHEVADAFLAEMTADEAASIYRKHATVVLETRRPGHWGTLAPDVVWINISRK